MTYGKFKEKVLQLIFSYSIAGDEIEISYNNQADYVKAIPGLLSTAQSYVYQIKKLPASAKLSDLYAEEYNDEYMLCTLPEDCLEMKPGIILPRGGYRYPFYRASQYRFIQPDKLVCPKAFIEKGMIEYWQRAVPVPDSIPDTYVLKNTEEVNEILPFYVAAFLVMYDDNFRYAALYNEFEGRLQRLAPNPIFVEESEIVDTYDFFPGWM